MINGNFAYSKSFSSPGISTGIVRASAIDATLLNYADAISDFGYRTEPARDTQSGNHADIGDFGRMGND